ncbi:MAG: ferrous iron transport protein B [Coprobacter sp.]|nr:ferrous iron transport protein B [Coprobacter sp.]
MRLSEVSTGQEVIITKVLGHGAFCKRIIEMGFVRGKKVKVLLNAPLKDPIKYQILDYEVSLRRSEAALIEVMTPAEAVDVLPVDTPGLVVDEDTRIQEAADRSGHTINIALVGNPNCGKTSLFNVASGAHEHVGNYSGVTVDAKKGYFNYKGYHFNIYDLPGTYSLSAYTPEELYVRRHIVEQQPDVIVNVVVASNLERNFFLTTELIDMDLSMVVALNMYDELEQSGDNFDYTTLSKMIGVPMIPTVSRTGKGIDRLFDTIIKVYERKEPVVRHVHINHGALVESAISVVKDAIKAHLQGERFFSPRYLAIKLLEGDKEVEQHLAAEPDYNKWIELRDREARRIENTLGENVETVIANEKYGFISGALKETLVPGDKAEMKTTRIIDALVTHKLFGFPIFLLIMWVMFEATFILGAYPMEWIESCVSWLSGVIERFMAPGPFKDLLIDGVIGGVGSVIVFLPNILILYLFISFMEDSGYMARAAFIMDKIMHKVGLHGKSFIPLVMGFGCNVPAIMATRTIESRSSRLITILINPFISCSARLPIYVLLIGTFFSAHASLVFMGLYALGILAAVVTARLLRKFYFKKDETPFVMELPPYRVPTLKATLRHMWGKAEQYLRKMGGIILVAAIVVWFLSYYPRPVETDGVDETTELVDQQKNSYLGRLGQWVAPVMEPLGFNWKIDIALLSGVAAKEIVVSTIGVLYAGEADMSEEDATLRARLTAPNPETGAPDFTPLVAISFMAFVLLYFPCLASVAAIVKETGSWKWGAFSIVYNTLFAWVVSFLIFNVGKLFI